MPICLHHVCQDLDGAPNLRTRHSIRRGQFSGQDALRHLLENEPAQRRPVKLQTDQGKEFYNQHVKRLLDQYGIHHCSTQKEAKAAVAERVNRMLKELPCT